MRCGFSTKITQKATLLDFKGQNIFHPLFFLIMIFHEHVLSLSLWNLQALDLWWSHSNAFEGWDKTTKGERRCCIKNKVILIYQNTVHTLDMIGVYMLYQFKAIWISKHCSNLNSFRSYSQNLNRWNHKRGKMLYKDESHLKLRK